LKTIKLTWQDLHGLALKSRVDAGGVTLVLERPVLVDIRTDAAGDKDEIRFFLDRSDPRAKDVFESAGVRSKKAAAKKKAAKKTPPAGR
jgi:hypothetical protein